MRRRIAVAILACLVAVSLCVTANAEQTRAANFVPRLSFNGTTAICEFCHTKFGASIGATMELWSGTTLEAIWSERATGRLDMSKTETVRKGQTYTLKVSCTVNGETTRLAPITKTCP